MATTLSDSSPATSARLRHRSRRRAITRWSGVTLIGAAVVMVAWVAELTTTFRDSARVHNWTSTWVGLDIAEMLALVLTGVCLIRRSSYTDVFAAMGAVLFAIDAWFDVLTSAGSRGQSQAILLACVGEIPLMLILGLLAWRSRRWFAVTPPERDARRTVSTSASRAEVRARI